jgi:hypothetical protein
MIVYSGVLGMIVDSGVLVTIAYSGVLACFMSVVSFF